MTPGMGAVRPDRRDLLLLGVVLVAFGAGFWRARERPAPAPFQRHPVAAPRGEAPRFQSRFVATRPGIHAHAACLVELADARVRAFWYSGSREGAPDVEIHTAVFDPDRGEWGEEKTVATPAGTQRSIWRYVRKVGNPASIRTPEGTLWLFYVTVSVGGWGGSAINAVASRDDGETWGPARRLVSSPFLNLSTMVRGEPVLYADGTIGLPVYHNLVVELRRAAAPGRDGRGDRPAPGERRRVLPAADRPGEEPDRGPGAPAQRGSGAAQPGHRFHHPRRRDGAGLRPSDCRC